MRENNGYFEIFNFEISKKEFETLDEVIGLEKTLELIFEDGTTTDNPSIQYLISKIDEIYKKGNEVRELIKLMNHKHLPYIYTEIEA